MAKFRRAPAGKRWIGGVCAGIAYTMGAPVWVVRLVVLLAILFWGLGILPYLVLWILVPRWDALPPDFDARTGD